MLYVSHTSIANRIFQENMTLAGLTASTPGLGDMHLTEIEPQANQFRCYRMEIVPGLFGDWGLIREWGSSGGGGRVRTDWFDSEEAAKDARFELNIQKAKRGYE